MRGDFDTLTFTFQWSRSIEGSSARPIAGATASSYTPTIGDIGYRLSFHRDGAFQFWGSATSDVIPAGTVVGQAGLVDSPVTITVPTTGSNGVDVSASIGSEWDVLNPTVTLQWYVCAPKSCTSASPDSKFTAIPGANYLDYVPILGQGGDRLFLEVTGSEPGFQTAHVDSAIVQLAADNVLVVSGPGWDDYPDVDGPLQVGYLLNVAGGQVQTPGVAGVVESWAWQYCSSDCESSGAVWSPGTGIVRLTGLPDKYSVPSSEYAAGTGYLRVTLTASAPGYLTTIESSQPEPIQRGLWDAQQGDPQVFVQPTGVTNTSTRYSIGGEYLPTGLTRTDTWYVGDQQQPGSSVIVDDPATETLPVYAILSYGGPAWTTATTVVAAIRATSPTTPPVSNSIIGDRFGETLSLAQSDPWTLTDYPGAPWQLTYSWCDDSACSGCRAIPDSRRPRRGSATTSASRSTRSRRSTPRRSARPWT